MLGLLSARGLETKSLWRDRNKWALTAMGSSEFPHLKFPFDLIQAEVFPTDGARYCNSAMKRVPAYFAVELKEQLVSEPLRLAFSTDHILGSCSLLH
jgi:hypothetical protein